MQIRTTVEEVVQAVNARDVESVSSLITPNAKMRVERTEPVERMIEGALIDSKKIDGAFLLSDELRKAIGSFPDLKCEMVSCVADEEHKFAAVHYKVSGTHQPVVLATNKFIADSGFAILRFSPAGRVVWMTAYPYAIDVSG